jgi:hypothetical protein
MLATLLLLLECLNPMMLQLGDFLCKAFILMLSEILKVFIYQWLVILDPIACSEHINVVTILFESITI